MVAIERARTNKGTLWAGTRRGRILVTKNADFTNPAAVVQEDDCCGTGFNERQPEVAFDRIDTPLQPQRYPSGISVDPSDSSGNTAYISFSGYNAYSPGHSGHVFKAVTTRRPAQRDLDRPELRTSAIFRCHRRRGRSGDWRPATRHMDWGVLKLPPRHDELGRRLEGGLPEVAVYEASRSPKDLKHGNPRDLRGHPTAVAASA